MLDNEVVKALRAAWVPCTGGARQPSAHIVGEAPDTLWKESFGDPSVARLEDRLVDSRQIADRIDASALNEVQRQTRALQYFEAD